MNFRSAAAFGGGYLALIAAAMPACKVLWVVMPRRGTPRCART
ncbi:hypothetical protein [Sorangium sp. So ce385]